jgi:D-alanyl-D-alanine dipeptidase
MMNEKQIRHTISGKIILVMIVIAGSLLTSSCSLARNASPVPAFCRQLVLVITDSVQDTLGTLMYFERENATSAWTRAGDTIAVAIGRHGLGWGRGLHNDKDRADLPFKKEGDGKSPAGVFTLSAVFGYQPADQMSTIAMPYIHVTDMTECIDDPSSRYYNQFVSRDQIERTGQVDWQSSEKMSKAGIYYELGVVVDHNWAHPNEKTAGCTAMSPQNMKKIVVWLDKSKHPVLIQLPKRSYLDLKKLWHLPELSKK